MSNEKVCSAGHVIGDSETSCSRCGGSDVNAAPQAEVIEPTPDSEVFPDARVQEAEEVAAPSEESAPEEAAAEAAPEEEAAPEAAPEAESADEPEPEAEQSLEPDEAAAPEGEETPE